MAIKFSAYSEQLSLGLTEDCCVCGMDFEPDELTADPDDPNCKMCNVCWGSEMGNNPPDHSDRVRGKRLYHGSPDKLSIGTVLLGEAERDGWDDSDWDGFDGDPNDADHVFVTPDLEHARKYSGAPYKMGWVYEVVSEGPFYYDPHSPFDMGEQYMVPEARVVGVVSGPGVAKSSTIGPEYQAYLDGKTAEIDALIAKQVAEIAPEDRLRLAENGHTNLYNGVYSLVLGFGIHVVRGYCVSKGVQTFDSWPKWKCAEAVAQKLDRVSIEGSLDGEEAVPGRVNVCGIGESIELWSYPSDADDVQAILPKCQYGPNYSRGALSNLRDYSAFARRGEKELAQMYLERALESR